MKIKICKKHGELEDKDTYLMKTSSGNLIKMCSICKRGYKNDWAKLNPDKVKISQLKKREKRLKELENGGILERLAYNEIPPRVEYRLTAKGQELVESIINLLQWMRKWSKSI